MSDPYAIVQLQYNTGIAWVHVSDWYSEHLAWVSLGSDNLNYRTVNTITGEVLTDKSVGDKNV